MLRTAEYQIRSGRLPAAFDGFRIAQLSDLHGAVYGDGNGRLIAQVEKFRPHMVVMTGDMAECRPHAVERCLELCRRLCGKFPVYYVMGNHEQAMGAEAVARLTEQLTGMGVEVPDNGWRTVSHCGSYVKLYGLVTPMVYYKDPLGEYVRGIRFSASDTERLLGKPDADTYNILLAHNPIYFPSYRDWGADLTLAGHIHGGVIRLPKLGGVFSPDVSLFPKYDGGHFEEEGRHLIVSRGLGNHFLVRVMNPPEVVGITLLKK